MQIEFDPRKDATNRRKHGVSLAEVARFEWDLAEIVADSGYDYGEQRFNTLGLLGAVVVCISHTETDDAIRIISMRKAENHEIEQLFSYL